MRAKIVLLSTEALSNKKIGQRLDLPRQIVSKWRKRFFEQRLAGLQERPLRGKPGAFPPEIIVAVKALACQLPKQLGLPFSKFTHNEAARVLDLHQGVWEGEPLSQSDFAISADEKISNQACRRLAPVTPPTAGRYSRVEHEYERMGALAYMAAWDVRQAKIFGLCGNKTIIDSFRDLVDLVMGQEPYRSARRVFWVTDNGSSHRGQRFIDRLQAKYPNSIQIHTPVHAS